VNPDDRAVVIGIGRYGYAADPQGWIDDLKGPDNDAADVAKWLRRGDGGGLPHDNVNVVRSADLPDPFPDDDSIGPAQQAVQKALNDVAKLPADALEGQYAGRRLYLYVSGHGVSQQADQAAILTAEAQYDLPLNVLITSWLEWFYTAARFKEFVLWVDTCATRVTGAYLQPCARKYEKGAAAADGKRFAAFAAGFDEEAVENEMPDGRWHGTFTYALLQGLDGAAGATVTSDNLRDYLRNNMSSFMREDQRVRPIAQEPKFPLSDPMTFATYLEKSKFPITLRFPQSCVGKRATVGTNASSPVLEEEVLQTEEWTPELAPGVYVVFVTDAGITQPFVVTGEGSDAVTVS
jgi:uncharacterized caspase-like protein